MDMERSWQTITVHPLKSHHYIPSLSQLYQYVFFVYCLLLISPLYPLLHPSPKSSPSLDRHRSFYILLKQPFTLGRLEVSIFGNLHLHQSPPVVWFLVSIVVGQIRKGHQGLDVGYFTSSLLSFPGLLANPRTNVIFFHPNSIYFSHMLPSKIWGWVKIDYLNN